jgi:protein-tyrosine-phosphatase
MKNKLKILSSILLIATLGFAQYKINKKLDKYINSQLKNITQISVERQEILKEIAHYLIEEKLNSPKLTFICTHNSRRSQMCQAWSFAAAKYFGVKNIEFFSGGTESTAFNTRAVDALKRVGLEISKTSSIEENQKYTLKISSDDAPLLMFSKKYSNKQNPQNGFCAVMVCSEADKSCPMVEGANKRVSLPYDDPKFYDNTPSESRMYDERCKQIALEMLYLFDYFKKKEILTIEIK